MLNVTIDQLRSYLNIIVHIVINITDLLLISPFNLITVESSPLKFAHCHGMKSFAKIITRGDHWYGVWKCLGWSRGTRDILRNSGGFLIGSKMIFMDLWQGK